MENDEIVVHINPVWKEKSDFIIFANIEEDKLPKKREQLWARQISEYQLEICCIPFFAYNLALGDEVLTETKGENRYIISRVVKRSGHYVFRVWLGNSPNPEVVEKEIFKKLNEINLIFEIFSKNLIAIDAPNSILAQKIADFLYKQERLGYLQYETGQI